MGFERFCEIVMKRPDMMSPGILRRWPGGTGDDQEWLRAEITSEIAKHPQDHWLKVLVDADVPCSPVATYADMIDNTHTVGKHMRINGYITEVKHRDYGPLKVVAPPVH